MLFNRKERILEHQVKVFLAWGDRKGTISVSAHKEWLDLFTKTCLASDVMDVSERDLQKFVHLVRQNFNGEFPVKSASQAVINLRRFYEARGKNGPDRRRNQLDLLPTVV